jgi:hypothetical protein
MLWSRFRMAGNGCNGNRARGNYASASRGPYADSVPLSAKLLKKGEHPEVINPNLPAFFKS